MTAGTRWRIGNAYAEITTDTPEKSLLESTTVYWLVETSREEDQCVIWVVDTRKCIVSSISKEIRKIFLATVASIEYDPNRTAFIALLHYADGEKRYILAPQGLQVGGICYYW